MIADFAALRARAQELGPRRVAVVDADDEVALTAAADAARLGLAEPVLIGDAAGIRARIESLNLAADLAGAELIDAADPALTAARLGAAGKADILLKGHLRTDVLLKAVLDREIGLRTDRLLNDVLLWEDTLGESRRLVAMTDGGINVAPTLEQKKQIVGNTIEVLHALGCARPKVALMSATEAVSPAVPSTLDARTLTELAAQGAFGEADVFGPLALDNALLAWAARAKGIENAVAGRADALIVPNIESGNLLGKAVKYLYGSSCAHLIVGAKLPVLIPSRVESADDKLNSIALGVIFASR